MILDGNLVSATLKETYKQQVLELNKINTTVCLAVIVVGDYPASKVYVNAKIKDCQQVGITSLKYTLSEDVTEQILIEQIHTLNKDTTVHGILIQLPLPAHINPKKIMGEIAIHKDVDCFNPFNVGRLMIDDPILKPCTPAGIITLLDFYHIPIAEKNCVIIGRSEIVGKPLSLLLLARDATVTIAHSKTQNLKEVTRHADLLISAVGKPNFVTLDMVKKDCVVIDVGMNRTNTGKLCGDVDFESVSKTTSYITPVPGGVGPMTRAMLLKNTIYCAKKSHTTP
ncbi:MAG: bifunctional 5,10-methylenetetrahydrofolate dehydrogenase/5,10-methenyltetrahydrofolate cyclohydrolase [Oscillospiraceae bacterium]